MRFGYGIHNDVLVYKNFDELLNLPYFIGHDQIGAFEAAVIGCEPGCKWIKDILDTYDGKSFIKANGMYDILTLPCKFHHVLTDLGYRFWRIGKSVDVSSETFLHDEKKCLFLTKISLIVVMKSK